MKSNAQKIALICMMVVCILCNINASNVDIDISHEETLVKAGTFCSEITITVPEGWKMAKSPDIQVLKSQNLKNFTYSGGFKQVGKASYLLAINVEVENPRIPVNYLEISIDCSLCKNICTIVSKNISLSFGITKNSSALMWILLLGFLGGFVLNFMPCVLPVILMKLKAGNSKSAIIGTITGNYVSFAAFATFIAFLKMRGESIGWGMHFQNSIFLEIATIILFILVLYSTGVITFSPSVQINSKVKHIFFSSTISSIIASAIAIPCTAPFLGAAAVFAIQGSTADLYSIFLVIATGFSFPYFLLLLFSKKFSMNFSQTSIFKKIIDGGVIITFLWVFWLLSKHLTYGAITLHILLFYFLKKRKLWAVIITAVLLLNGGLFSEKHAEDPYRNINEKLSSEIAKNKVVIFNITADWCLTCKYNKYRVLNSEKIREVIKSGRITLIEADMTGKSESLMNFIRAHNRIGIPFTIVFSSKAPEGILLGEILTEEAMIDAINVAK
ncbi:MAG: thioredoxin family protein [Holosporaceae bacterium]|jgi:suppressor for copper-sensitivity B|nr:thioredoxin family protein [Holosporaceae bacterium]